MLYATYRTQNLNLKKNIHAFWGKINLCNFSIIWTFILFRVISKYFSLDLLKVALVQVTLCIDCSVVSSIESIYIYIYIYSNFLSITRATLYGFTVKERCTVSRSKRDLFYTLNTCCLLRTKITASEEVNVFNFIVQII